MIKFNDQNEVIGEEYNAILVGVELDEDISYSMEELKGLCEAASIEPICTMVQKMERPNTATLIGKGKVEELKEAVTNMEADLVVFNDELTGMQLRNLEEATGVRVIDRVILILDIFSKRATSREGKLQVELAQLRYRLPRLTGFGRSLSRLGGGIGTRGPGEKKLETDRRHIERRIYDIRDELRSIAGTRTIQKKQREKNDIPVVCIVGYTNSGKSALMNDVIRKLDRAQDAENKEVFEKDMLFATLDTYRRRIDLDDSHSFVLVDTIGFVSRLPHLLVEAFKSTLEIVTEADLLLDVVDLTADEYDMHVKVTEKVLKEIGADDKEIITCYNKMDLLDEGRLNALNFTGKNSFLISAKYDRGVDELLEEVKKRLFRDRVEVRYLVPFAKGAATSGIRKDSEIKSVEYVEEGTLITCEIPEKYRSRYEEFEI
ncbi:MAG: GTPase HflX [Clostridia bacterium]|nr:GTPase HflX [Clostridia bacterium]